MEWIYAVALINGFVGRKHGEWITTREQADNAISLASILCQKGFSAPRSIHPPFDEGETICFDWGQGVGNQLFARMELRSGDKARLMVSGPFPMKFFPVTWTNTEVVCEFDLNQLRERSS